MSLFTFLLVLLNNNKFSFSVFSQFSLHASTCTWSKPLLTTFSFSFFVRFFVSQTSFSFSSFFFFLFLCSFFVSQTYFPFSFSFSFFVRFLLVRRISSFLRLPPHSLNYGRTSTKHPNLVNFKFQVGRQLYDDWYQLTFIAYKTWYVIFKERHLKQTNTWLKFNYIRKVDLLNDCEVLWKLQLWTFVVKTKLFFVLK
jgi:hypothetical protein